jgi:hypothetical protein
MFVRWQRYRSQALYSWHRERNDRRGLLKAVLVESVRVNGQPRQKHVAFLASLPIKEIGSPQFWLLAPRGGAAVNRATLGDGRQTIEAITQKVRRLPTMEEVSANSRKVSASRL